MSARIAVIFGSDSDWPVMEGCVKQLRAFGLEPHVEVMSAHRSPERCAEFASAAEKNDFDVIIAAARDVQRPGRPHLPAGQRRMPLECPDRVCSTFNSAAGPTPDQKPMSN